MRSRFSIFVAILLAAPLAFCLTSHVEAQPYWDTDVPVDLYMDGDGGGIRGHGGNNRPPPNPPLSAVDVIMLAIQDALDIFDEDGVPNYEETFPGRVVTLVVAADFDLIPYPDGSCDCLLWTVDIQYWHRAGPGGK